jgi:hypothetical protein
MNIVFDANNNEIDKNNLETKKRKIDIDESSINKKLESKKLLNHLYGENEMDIKKTMIKDYIDVMSSDIQVF